MKGPLNGDKDANINDDFVPVEENVRDEGFLKSMEHAVSKETGLEEQPEGRAIFQCYQKFDTDFQFFENARVKEPNKREIEKEIAKE